ncbi:MAG: hypothetical protein AAF919_02225 [Pseudomonadota bacterium]
MTTSRRRSVSRRFSGPELVAVETPQTQGPLRFLEVFVLGVGLISIFISVLLTAFHPASGEALSAADSGLFASVAGLPVRADLCPTGWEARYAEALGRDHSAILEWHRHEAEFATNADVLRVAGRYLTTPFPIGPDSTLEQAHEQILLCVARDRGLIAFPEG